MATFPASYVLRIEPGTERGFIKALSAPRNPIEAMARTRTPVESDRAMAKTCGAGFVALLAEQYPTVWTKDRALAALANLPSTQDRSAA